jgi:hypothetical protein
LQAFQLFRDFMINREQTLKIKTSTLCALAVIAFLIQYPVRTLVADVLYGMVPRILDDKTTEELDVVPLSAESMALYQKAAALLNQAVLWDGGNAVYPKALSELYQKMGTWSEVMEGVGERLPVATLAGREARQRAEIFLKMAIALEPSNPDYHLALGAVAQADKPASLYPNELEKTVQLYPKNSSLRYAVAMHYLLYGDKGNALEQANILSGSDDSYLLPKTVASLAIRERRSEAYLSFLANSYLAKAFEIAWRSSDNNVALVKAMAPEGQEAKDTLQLFFESKGIDVNKSAQ